MISTSIKLDGEQEFKKQLSNVNGELRNLKSDMQLVTAQFEGQANSLEALTAKDELLRKEIEQQEEKVRALTNAYQDSLDVYGEVDSRTDKYRQSLNRAKTELLNMQRELQDNSRYMDEARRSADKTASSIDEFGDAVRKADGADGKGGLSSLIGSLGTLKNFLVGGAVVAGIEEVAGAIFEITDATKEYRQIMGTLEVSSQQAGYTTEQTAKAYERLYGVLGDTQTAATTVANLQAIGLEQERLMQLVDQVTGAWATYGDSIPIDGLSEAINETIQVGKVTGVLADVLNWAGISEDEFNAKLEKTADTTRRADLLLHTLAEEGLTAAGEGWRDLNQDIVSANESQMEWEQAMGELGEFLQPAADALRSFGADAIEFVTARLKDAVEWFRNFKDEIKTGWDTRVGAYSSEAQAVKDSLFTAQEAEVTNQLATANVTEPRSGASDAVLAEAASALNALRSERANGGSTTINIITELDGEVVARNQARYSGRQNELAGSSLIS